MNNKGVVYIAFNTYVNESIFSAKSVKRKCKNLSTSIFTNINVSNKYFDNVNIVNPVGKRNKCDFLHNTPYCNTLYLDSDIKVQYNIIDIYMILDKFDIALVHDFSRKSNKWSRILKEYKKIPYCFSEFGGGVVLFKKSNKMERFFKLWKHLYYEYKKEFGVIADQPSLRVALWNSDLRIHTLPIEYNVRNQECRDKWNKRVKTGEEDRDFLKPRILHSRGLNSKKHKIKMYKF